MSNLSSLKICFKYEFGYVNIKDKVLHLTNTGNWSEIAELSEKTQQVDRKNDKKSSSVIGFMLVIACILIYLFFNNYINQNLGITLIFLTFGSGYSMYQYLKTEIGSKFKIPFEKIKEIKINHNVAIISFSNGEQLEENYTISNIEEKGIIAMQHLKNKLGNEELSIQN